MLDCLTEIGLVYIRHQKETEELIRKLDYTVVSFFKDDCPIDVLISRDNKLLAVGEIKCRDKAGSVNLTNDYIKKNDYLITKEKIERGLQIGEIFGVPYYVIVNVLNEKNLLIWNVNKYTSAKTKTQSTCNGGVSYRENAFLKFEDAYLYKYE